MVAVTDKLLVTALACEVACTALPLTDTLPPATSPVPVFVTPTSKSPVVAVLLIFPLFMTWRDATPKVVPVMPVVLMVSVLLAVLPVAAAETVLALLVMLPKVRLEKLFSMVPTTLDSITAVLAPAPQTFCWLATAKSADAVVFKPVPTAKLGTTLPLAATRPSHWLAVTAIWLAAELPTLSAVMLLPLTVKLEAPVTMPASSFTLPKVSDVDEPDTRVSTDCLEAKAAVAPFALVTAKVMPLVALLL